MARSCMSVVIVTRQPSPTPPSTFSSGTHASSRKSSLNSASPVSCRSGRIDTPGWSMSMTNIVRPRDREPSTVSVRVRIMHQRARCASEVHTFWPEILHPSPSRTARVLTDARSEPASGSENPWHQISSADSIGPRKRAFCSSSPWAMIVGPIIASAIVFAMRGARAREISST